MTKLDVLIFVLGNLWRIDVDVRDFVKGGMLTLMILQYILHNKDTELLI